MLQQLELCRVPFTGGLKFEGDPEIGEISGYGSVFNVLDANGDMVMPGAFDETLAEQKSAGRIIPMFGEHSFAFIGGDPYPIGGWTTVEPDAKGLRVTGKLIGLKHPDVARVWELVKEQLIAAMSIAFRVRDGGAEKGVKAGEPRRRIKALDLFSIDLVGDPANPLARIESLKSVLALPNHTAAASSILSAYGLCTDCLGGGNAPNKAEREALMGHLQDAHRHLTGNDIPAALMRFDQLREFKKWLHLPVDQGGRGYSNSQADELAELIFKSMPRDEDRDALAGRKQAVSDIGRLFSGFSLKPESGA